MVSKIRNLIEKLNNEPDYYNQVILSELINIYYNTFLTKEEKEKIINEIKKAGLRLSYNLHDTLYDEESIHLDLADKVIEIFYRSKFENYNIAFKEDINTKIGDEIATEILKYISTEAYDNYIDLEKNNRVITKDLGKDITGKCIYGMKLEQDYILINSRINKLMYYILTKIHESGHSFESSFIKDFPNKSLIDVKYNNYHEVISYFFERLALDYMIKNNIFKDDAEIALNNYYSNLLYYFYNLDALIYYIRNNSCNYSLTEYEIIDNPCTKKYDKKETRFSCYVPERGEYHSVINCSYGLLLSEHFFDIYRKNKKEGLDSLKDFILSEEFLDNKGLIEKTNLLDNSLDFLRPNLEENTYYMRNRKKW